MTDPGQHPGEGRVDGLLPEDYSEIKLVPSAVRDIWFRSTPRPDYFCERCDRYHRAWSAIGERHNPKVKR